MKVLAVAGRAFRDRGGARGSGAGPGAAKTAISLKACRREFSDTIKKKSENGVFCGYYKKRDGGRKIREKYVIGAGLFYFWYSLFTDMEKLPNFIYWDRGSLRHINFEFKSIFFLAPFYFYGEVDAKFFIIVNYFIFSRK